MKIQIVISAIIFLVAKVEFIAGYTQLILILIYISMKMYQFECIKQV